MAHHWWSLHLLYFGQLQQVLAENDRARQLDPFSMPGNHLRVHALLGLHEYDRALEQAETEAAIDPRSAAPHAEFARVHWIQGLVEQALEDEKTTALLLKQPGRAAHLEEVAVTFRQLGLPSAALSSARFKAKGYPDDFLALDVAYQYGVAGDKEKTLEWLNRSFRDHYEELYFVLKSAPEFDLVRSEPRYRELLRRKGLPE